MRLINLVTIALWSAGAMATEIHTCPLPDGTVMYSQLPCPTEEPVENSDTPVSDENALLDDEEADAIAVTADEDEPADPQDVAECKQRYRDAIDAIDLELRENYRPELADDYKQRLLALTRQLREC